MIRVEDESAASANMDGPKEEQLTEEYKVGEVGDSIDLQKIVRRSKG